MLEKKAVEAFADSLSSYHSNNKSINPNPRREPGGPGVAALLVLNLGAASVWLLPCNRT